MQYAYSYIIVKRIICNENNNIIMIIATEHNIDKTTMNNSYIFHFK